MMNMMTAWGLAANRQASIMPPARPLRALFSGIWGIGWVIVMVDGVSS